MIGSILIMGGLFFVSVSLPFLAFLLPAYQLKRLEKWGLRKSLLIHFVFLVSLAMFQKEFAWIYGMFTFGISIFYYLFYYFRNKETRRMDEIAVTALVLTGAVLIFLSLFYKNYIPAYELAMNIWKEKYKLSNAKILEIHHYILEYYPSLIFHYIMLLTFFTYLLVSGMKKYQDWLLHCLWVLPYAISVFLGRIVGEGNFYITNLEEISKAILLWYGIKSFYEFFADKYQKYAWIIYGLSFLLALQYPNFMFILGGVMALGDTLVLLKEQEKKEKN